MSVYYDNRNRPEQSEQRPDARPSRGALDLLRERLVRFAPEREGADMTFERVEGLVHLALAFIIVAGAALVLRTTLFAEPEGAPAAQQSARAAAPAAVAESEAPAQKLAAAPQPAAEAPAPAPEQSAAPLAQADPAAAAPEPLAPPPARLREQLSARSEAPQPAPAPAAPAAVADDVAAPAAEARVAEPAPAAAQPADRDAEKDAGHMAKCYFKLSGKVQNSGPCRVSHTGRAVVFQLPGKPLEISQVGGRVWTAKLGGRNLGKVYRNKDAPCWGAKGFYACENT